MLEKNSILFGFVVGCLTPVFGYLIFDGFFDLLTQFGLLDEITASTGLKRIRTITLLGICSVLLPFHMFQNRGSYDSMRGMIIPTMIYAAAWIYKFFGHLIGF